MLTKIYFNLSSFEIFNQESWYESLAKQLPHPIITSESNESVKNQSARENKNEEGGGHVGRLPSPACSWVFPIKAGGLNLCIAWGGLKPPPPPRKRLWRIGIGLKCMFIAQC